MAFLNMARMAQRGVPPRTVTPAIMGRPAVTPGGLNGGPTGAVALPAVAAPTVAPPSVTAPAAVVPPTVMPPMIPGRERIGLPGRVGTMPQPAQTPVIQPPMTPGGPIGRIGTMPTQAPRTVTPAIRGMTPPIKRGL
jgi:hypothetical protein